MILSPHVWWAAPALVGIGYALLWWMAHRATGDRQVHHIVLWSYLARVLLGVALYVISFYGWPIFKSLHRLPGFWAFGLDSQVYHHYGRHIAQAWAKGVELPNPELGVEYFVVVAGLYRLFGPHPLYPVLLNSWLGALNGLLAFLIGRRLAGHRIARLSAILVGFWPSSLLWSSQLLKEALSWCLILTALWLVAALISDLELPTQRRLSRWLWRCVALGSVLILMTRLRFYLGSAFSLAAFGVLLPAAVFAFLRRRPRAGIGYVGVAAVIVFSTLFARTLDVFALISPAHPETGHFALAVKHRDRGALEGAEEEFHQAIALNPNYREAYLGLATIKVQQGKLDEALEVYIGYLEREDPGKRQLVKKIIAMIYAERGNHDAAQGQWAQAGAAYERALLFDPTSVPVHVSFGIVLAHQEKFEMATVFLDKALTFVQAEDEQARVAVEQARREVEQARAYAEFIRIEAERVRLEAEHARLEAERARIEAERVRLEAEHARLQAERARIEAERAQLTIMPDAQVGAVQMEDATGGALAPHPSRTRMEPPQLTPLLMPHDGRQLIAMALAVFPTESGAPKARLSQAPSERLGQLAQGVSRIDEQAFQSAYETTPESLGSRRTAFVASGGYSLMDAWAQINTPRKLIAYLPRALAIGLLAPFPWQWFDVGGSTGIMRIFAGAEMVLIYWLIPGLLLGVWRILQQRRAMGYFILAFIGATIVPVSLVVANVGTLFRLRLLAFLPLLVVGAIGQPLGIYRRMNVLARGLKIVYNRSVFKK